MEDGDGVHRNEAISAVADVGFLGEEEEEDDYEDLYNDVNVGEGFLQSLRASEEEHEEKAAHVKQEPLDVEPLNRVPIPGVAAVNVKIEKDSVLEGAFLDSRVTKTEMVPKGPITVPGGGIKVELGERSGKSLAEIGGQIGNSSLQPQPHVAGNSNYLRHGVGAAGGSSNSISNVNGGNCNGGGPGNIGGGTLLFVGELHWWTTDAELESELSKYGQVKEVKFFDEKASGKSKGYCQVEFYDPVAASACKEGMNGHLFNGRPCVVAFASPYSIRRMGEAQVNKSQAMGQGAPQQGRRGGPGDIGGSGGYARGNAPATGTNYQGGEGGRNFGRGGGWGRGGAMGNRGQMGQMRNRMGFGGRGIIGSGATGFGQGLASATPPLMHPQAMMGQGFDPSYAAAMGRMGGYGGFPTGPSPLPGMMPSFPPVGGVGLPGVAPHVNPAFFGRGMPTNGIGMMPGTGMEGTSVGMWSDPSMGGWGSEDQGGRVAESSYGEDATSDQRYGDGSHERGGWSNVDKEKDRPPERGFSGTSPTRGYREDRKPGWDRREKDLSPEQDRSGRRHRDEREMGWEPERDHKRDSERERERERERGRSRDHERDHYREERDLYRDERDRHPDHRRYKDRELDHDDEWDRGHSSRTHSKSRMSREEEQRHRSREMDHGKRRRLPSE